MLNTDMTPYKHLLFTYWYNAPGLTPWNQTGDWVKGDPSKTNAVAYANGGGSIVVDATFSSKTIPPNALVEVRFVASGFPSGPVYSDWEAAPRTGPSTFTASNVTSLDSLLTIYNCIFQPDFITGMELAWEFKVDNGTTKAVTGSSVNPFYVTRGGGAGAYHTVIHTGCAAAKYHSVEDAVFDAIWGEFSGDDICIQTVMMQNGAVILNPDGKLYYYGIPVPGSTLNPPESVARKEKSYTTKSLLQHKDGTCYAWARFLTDVLRAQGIDAVAKKVTITEEFVTWGGNTDRLVALVADVDDFGQRTKGIHHGAKPLEAQWADHAVVKYNGSYYDSSYGKKYDTFRDMIDAFSFYYPNQPYIPGTQAEDEWLIESNL